MSNKKKRVNSKRTAFSNKLVLLKIKLMENEFKDLILKNYFFDELNFIINSYKNKDFKLNEIFEVENNRKKGAKEKTQKLNIILDKRVSLLSDIYNKIKENKLISDTLLKESIYIIKLLKLNKIQYIRIFEKNNYNNKDLMGDYRKKINKIIEYKQKLISFNRFLVAAIANRYTKNVLVTVEDLVQEGLFGLMKAVNMIDPLRNIELSTYSYNWIKLYIGRAIINQSKMIRVPVYVIERVNKLNKISQEYKSNNNEYPTYEELLSYDDITEKDIKNLKKYRLNEVSSIENNKELISSTNHEEEICNKEFNNFIFNTLHFLISELTDVEKYVIYKKYKLTNFYKGKLTSKKLTDQELCEVEKSALFKLKQLAKEKEIFFI